MWLPLLLFGSSLFGCAHVPGQVLQPVAPGVEHFITNTLPPVAQQIATIAPQPYSTAVEAGAAAILALLAAWQGITHRKLNTLTESQPSTKPQT